MKKLTITTLLAASIIAISSIANADTKVKVNGQFNYKYSNDEDSNGTSVSKLENQGSRVGVSVTQSMGEGLEGFGKFEFGVDTEDTGSNPLDSRLGYVGLKHDSLGALSVGRQSSPFFDNVGGLVKQFEAYGQNSVQKSFKRDISTAKYSVGFGGVELTGLVKIDGASGEDGTDIAEGTVTYKLGEGISIADFGDTKVTAGMSRNHASNYDAYGFGFNLDGRVIGMDGVSIGYAHTIKDPKTGSDKTGNEYIASYQMTDKLKLLGGYGKIKDGNTYMTAGTHYNVNKKVTLYTEFQSVDVNSGTDTTGISTGIKFKF